MGYPRSSLVGFPVRKPIGIALGGMLSTALVGLAVFYGAWKATQQAPEFYQTALHKEPEKQKEKGAALEKQVLELHNEVRHTGRWEASFSDEQINGWLAADLPVKFPNALPKGVSEPRVAIEADEAQVACKYDSPKISTVFSMSVEISLTEEPNVVAVRIRKARAGLLPISLKQILDHATRYANKSEIPLRWVQENGDPVALVTVPSERKEFIHRRIHIETVELRDGEVYLAGRTDDSEHSPPPTVRQASFIKADEEVH
jgi:hypothetical protein